MAPVTGAWARPTTPEEAKNVVMNWLGLDAQPMNAAMSQQVKEVRSYPGPDATPAYYVIFLNPRGLVFVPADDQVEPIIGFLPAKKYYNPSRVNPLGALVSNDIPGRVLQARVEEARALKLGEVVPPDNPRAKAQRKWALLADPAVAPEDLDLGRLNVANVWVAPFVRSRWSQTTANGQACYNYYTPPNADGSSDNYPSGCVATAMSQLMRYFRRPKVGVGTAAFTIYINGAPQSENLRGGDGSGGAYDWAGMVLRPDQPTAAQRQAIGALLHDAGLSVNMNYTGRGSGADTLKAAGAFTGVFKYSNAKNGFNGGDNLPAADRDQMVNPNLNARYPVLLGITGPSGGHAIVCDGYGFQAGTMYHHLNMGWAGFDDAWYNLPDINTTYYSFTSVYKCVYNVYVWGSGEIIAGRVKDENGLPVGGAKVTATRTSGGTFRRSVTTDANGIYALHKVPSAAPFRVRVTKPGYRFTIKYTNTGTSTNYSTNTGNVWGLNFVGRAL